MSQVLEKAIKERIFHGEYSIGSPLKSERDYAAEFGLSTNKVHRTLQKLVQEGYLGSKRGSGYFVNTEFECQEKQVRAAYIFISHVNTRMNELLRLAAVRENIWIDTITCDNSAEAFNRTLVEIIENAGHDLIMIHPGFSMSWVDGFGLALERHFPLIFYDYQDIPDVFPKIGINHFELGFLAAKVLCDHDYRQVLYLGYDENLNSGARLRWQGFDTGCRYFKLNCDSLRLTRADMEMGREESDRNVFAWLEQYRKQGRGLFAASGSFTFQVARYCYRNRIVLPDDFGFLGTDFSKIEGLNYLSSCISGNPDQMIARILKLIKQTAGDRTITESLSINITPIYNQGETL